MTVPTQTALEVPQTGLGQALGLGIQQGSQIGLQNLLKNFLSAKQQGLTAFQEISTEQRERERKRKVESSVLESLKSLADPKAAVILPKNIPAIAEDVNALINQGVPASQALNQGVSNFQLQQDSLGLKKKVKGTIDLPDFKAKKAESLKEDTVNQLRDNSITNPTLMNRVLKKRGWSTKDRQDIVKRVKEFGVRPIESEITKKAKTLTPQLANKFLKLQKEIKKKLGNWHERLIFFLKDK